MKIVYCTNSIRYLGGIQRVTIVKANALAEIDGNDVFIVVTDNKEGRMVEKLSPKVKLIDLDINYYHNDYKRSFIENFFVSIIKRYKHRHKLWKCLKEINPDVVISIGMSEKYMIPAMKKRTWKIIREFHYAKYYRLSFANTVFERLSAHLHDFIEFKIGKHLLKWDRIVVLSNEDKATNWKEWENVIVMPNPTSFRSNNSSDLNERVVMSMGRLSISKNFQSLINAFKIVVDKHPDWILKLYGEGEQKQNLINRIEDLGLQNNVFLMGYSNDVASCLLKSSIFALSSVHEGFSLAIVEAMECGVPVVSYQCPCGPKDIISEGKDGFLVPVNDEVGMADRICRLIEDKEMRKKMGLAAKETANNYHIDHITKQWMALFNELNENK